MKKVIKSTDVKKSTDEKPRKRRFFTSGDPLLDKIYQEVDESMREKYNYDEMKAFSYSFENDTHIIELYLGASKTNKIRFVKKENNSSVSFQVFDNFAEKWRDAENLPEIQTDVYWKGHEGSPIMWPIFSKSTSENLGYSGFLHSLSSKKIYDLKKDHPIYTSKYEKPASSPEEEEQKEKNQKKINQLEIVLHKKWSKIIKKHDIIQKKMMTKIWWEHFVDRDIFKSLACVVGVSKNSVISWRSYAMFSNHPNLENIMKNINDLGIERRKLTNFPLDKWDKLQAKDIVGASWRPNWHKVSSFPPSAQITIIKMVDVHLNDLNDLNIEIDLDDTPSNIDFANIINSDAYPTPKVSKAKEEQEKVIGMFWSLMDDIEKHMEKDNIKPSKREYDMMVNIVSAWSNMYVYKKQAKVSGSSFDFLKDSSKLFSITASNFIYPIVKTWRESCPESYRKWGYNEKDMLVRISKNILQSSYDKKELIINPLDDKNNPYHTFINIFDGDDNKVLSKMKIIYTKNSLKKEINTTPRTRSRSRVL